jgi:hypothetical protein
MTRNMSTSDRLLRAALAAPAALGGALVLGPATILGIVLLALAAIMLGTAAIGYCPLYALFGLSTRERRRPAAHRG